MLFFYRSTPSIDIRVHRAGSQLKTHEIPLFGGTKIKLKNWNSLIYVFKKVFIFKKKILKTENISRIPRTILLCKNLTPRILGSNFQKKIITLACASSNMTS